jgi:hypothetical protein
LACGQASQASDLCALSHTSVRSSQPRGVSFIHWEISRLSFVAPAKANFVPR